MHLVLGYAVTLNYVIFLKENLIDYETDKVAVALKSRLLAPI